MSLATSYQRHINVISKSYQRHINVLATSYQVMTLTYLFVFRCDFCQEMEIRQMIQALQIGHYPTALQGNKIIKIYNELISQITK